MYHKLGYSATIVSKHQSWESKTTGFASMSVTLVPHRVGEFGQVWQQFSLQAHWCQTEVSEQGLGSLPVLPVLRGTT